MGIWCSGKHVIFHCGDRGSNPGAVKFDIANIYVKVPSGSNRLFLCPLDVLHILYCHQPVPCELPGYGLS